MSDLYPGPSTSSLSRSLEAREPSLVTPSPQWHDVTIRDGAGSWVGHSEGFARAADRVSDIDADGETDFLVLVSEGGELAVVPPPLRAEPDARACHPTSSHTGRTARQAREGASPSMMAQSRT
jgi:hypothetical protein